MDGNPAANAGEMGSIPHAAEQLSLNAITTVPVCCNY